ncbi:E3 ubiquitin-protein ligase TRIM71-like [Mercenaria mercenaria]|uniref:E3 ubiquitin-protein ligase TRIM71-like n=1 Tax=Mercenaria mercenaria TaxID=6596 RepID=UPI00234F45BA|nr:E3 ubiquitin-protein ligase TRIM71-like [Mercenaria mercenaria]
MSQCSTTPDSVHGRKKKKKKRRGKTSDSKEKIESDQPDVGNICCNPCKNVSGNHIPAEKFCVNCSEYLCKSCSDYHTKLAATREHLLQDKESVPKDKPKVKERAVKCYSHPDNVIDHYCRSCDLTGCQACITLHHKTCTKVDYMSSTITELKDSKAYGELSDTLKLLTTELDFTGEALKCNENKTEFLKETARTAIKKQKDEVSKILNDREHEILEVIEKMDKDKKTKLKSASVQHSNLISEVNSLTSDLEEKEQRGNLLEFFITMKRDHNLLQKLIHKFQVLQKENETPNYGFAPSMQLCEALKKADAIGSITQLSAGQKRHLTFRKAISVKSEQDWYSNWVGSVCVISERILVTADQGFLKVINTDTGKIIFILTVPKLPAGITKTADKEIAVTINQEKKVMFFSFAENGALSFEREFEADGECKGIAHTNGKLILTFSNPGKVEIVDMKGTVLKCFKEDMVEYKFLKYCSYVAVSKTKDIFRWKSHCLL